MGGIGIAVGAVGVAATATAVFLNEAFQATMDFAGQVDDLNDKLGIGAEAASAWAVAFKVGETDVEAGGAAIKKLSRNIIEGNEAFEKYGIATKTASGSARELDAVMLDVAGVFEKLPDGAEKNALAMELFGKGGDKMIAFLNNGKEGVTGFLGEAEKLGLVLSQETVDAQDAVNASAARLGFAFTGLQVGIGSELLPVIAEFMDTLIPMVVEVGAFAGDVAEAFTIMGESVGPDIKSMMAGIGGLGPILQGAGKLIADFALGIDFAFRAGGVILSFFQNTFDGMVKVFAAGVMQMVVRIKSMADIIGLGLAGEFDKIGPRIQQTADEVKTLSEISTAGLWQTANAATGLAGALANAGLEAFNDTAALRNLGQAGVEAGDKADASLKKYTASLTQAGAAITEHGVKVTELGAKQDEINNQRIASNARVNADLKQSYDDAVLSMSRRQEDWAAEEGALRKSATERMKTLKDEEEAKHKGTSDRIAEINRILQTGQTVARMADLQAERSKLEAELVANDAAAVKKSAALETELNEKFLAFEREKTRAIQDHNLSVTRAAAAAQFKIDSANAAADAEIAAIQKKKAVEEAAVASAQASYDGLKGKINEVTGALVNQKNAAIDAANAMASVGLSPGNVPGRASGGPVAGGMPYMVGERGPELFVPYSNGNIVPGTISGASGGSVGPSITVVVQGSVVTERQLKESIQNALLRDARRNGSYGL